MSTNDSDSESDSKQLLYFIKQFDIPRFSHLSNISKLMISQIVDKMKEAVQSWRGYKDIVLDTTSDFPKGNSYGHIVKEIREEFENQPKIGKQYLFSIGSRNFTICLICPFSASASASAYRNKMYKRLDKMIYKMYVWLFVCNQFASPACSPDITIYVYMTNHKKILPEIDHIPLDQQHANTAFTFACPLTSNEMYVFRSEEWFKVFIHESFHCFGLDFSTLPEEETKKKMFSIFPIKCDLRFYETYTEIWAEIINVIFISVNTYSCKENKINIDKLSKTIENHLYNEQVFSLFQCSKVLDHMGLKYRELYEMTSHAKKIRDEQYKENTHVFSYYILKSIIIFHYNEFLEWCSMYNKNSIQFVKTQENINHLFEFIKAKHNSADFLRTMDIFENWFRLLNIKRQPIQFALKTMRMSISE